MHSGIAEKAKHLIASRKALLIWYGVYYYTLYNFSGWRMAKPTGNVDLFNLPPQLKHHEIKEKLKYSFMLSHGETWWLYSAKILVSSIFATLLKIWDSLRYKKIAQPPQCLLLGWDINYTRHCEAFPYFQMSPAVGELYVQLKIIDIALYRKMM